MSSTVGASAERRSNHDVFPSVLPIDLADPFFFDHPLDHVPGMFLLAGLLDRVRLLKPVSTWGHTQLTIEFTRLCRIEPPTRLLVVPNDAQRPWLLMAAQNGQYVCRGSMGYDLPRRSSPDATPLPRDHLPAEPFDSGPGHRQHPENVMVCTPQVEDGRLVSAALREPPPGHRFDPLANAHRGVERIIEAVRQLGSSILFPGSPAPGAIQLLTGFHAELPALPAPASRLALSCALPTDPVRAGRRVSTTFTVHDLTHRLTLGWVTMTSLRVTPAIYQRSFAALAVAR